MKSSGKDLGCLGGLALNFDRAGLVMDIRKAQPILRIQPLSNKTDTNTF